MESTNVISRIVSAFFGNQYPKEMEQELQAWIVDDTHAEEKDHALKTQWNDLPLGADRSVYRSLREVCSKLGLVRSKALRSPLRPLLRVAAVILPLLLAVGGYFYYRTGQAGPTTQLATEHGKHGYVKLSDGTEVWLNAGSMIYYPEHFGRRERRVRLEGEGYFNVAKNPRKPFIVEASDSVAIQALGTEFNVRSYPDQEAVSITLHSGAVRVDAAGQQLLMEPRHQLVFNRLTAQAELNRIEREIDDLSLWRSGRLVFHCSTAGEILRSLERHFAVSIRFDKAIFADDHYYMHFQNNETLEDVLGILSDITGGFVHSRDGNQITITGSPDI